MEPTPERRIEILSLARYTLPVHLLLPAGLWVVAQLDITWAGVVLLALHLLFPLLLAVTWRWWWGQGPSVLILVILNHLASLLGAAVWLELILWFSSAA